MPKVCTSSYTINAPSVAIAPCAKFATLVAFSSMLIAKPSSPYKAPTAMPLMMPAKNSCMPSSLDPHRSVVHRRGWLFQRHDPLLDKVPTFNPEEDHRVFAEIRRRREGKRRQQRADLLRRPAPHRFHERRSREISACFLYRFRKHLRRCASPEAKTLRLHP